MSTGSGKLFQAPPSLFSSAALCLAEQICGDSGGGRRQDGGVPRRRAEALPADSDGGGGQGLQAPEHPQPCQLGGDAAGGSGAR